MSDVSENTLKLKLCKLGSCFSGKCKITAHASDVSKTLTQFHIYINTDTISP